MGYSLESYPRPTKTYRTKAYDRISKQHGFDGTGKTILVTGGASGIGYTISQAFAEAGAARIAVVGRSSGPLEKAKANLEASFPSTKILPYQDSITDHSRMDEILQELGTVDVLILNAAVAHRRAQASEISTEEVQDAFNVNVVAPFNISRAYLDMPQPTGGRKTVIYVTAAAAHLPGPFRVGYGPSKAAGAQVMQNFAAQYQQDESVRVFSFHPGSLYTPGVAQHIPKAMLDWDEVELPAYFAVWLAGPDSGFLNGRFLWANWDVDELIALKDRLVKDPTFLTIGLIQ
jgi:NAD(P)-dependent dehydrogenase (short-subunit alcohol dehydrogenase family)